MKENRRYTVPGFTLLDMLIAMILSAVLIFTFYWLLMFTQKQFAEYNRHQNEMLSMLVFRKALMNDIESSDYILTYNDANYYFIYPHDTITYSLSPLATITRKGITDTFYFVAREYESGCLMLTSGKKVVKKINMVIQKPIKIDDISFSKYYSSEQLMNIP